VTLQKLNGSSDRPLAISSSDAVPTSHSDTDDVVDVYDEANRLTARLCALETELATIRWKVETTLEKGDYALSFRRIDRGWSLVWMSRKKGLDALPAAMSAFRGDATIDTFWNSALLKDANITAKAHAAEWMPELLELMRKEYDARIASIQRGHAALNLLSVPRNDDGARKEKA
jgi:hypothetical protein